MKLFNYIGEFFLFRWLFGKFKKSTNEHNAHTECLETSIDRDTKSLNDNHNEDIAHINDAIPPISDDLIDDSDSSENLDDLDIFMRNNSGNNCSYPHHRDFDFDYHAAVIVVSIMIGPQEVMVNRMMISMTSRTTMT